MTENEVMTAEKKDPVTVNVIVDGKEAVLSIVVKRIVTGFDVTVEANNITKRDAAGILSQIVTAWIEDSKNEEPQK